MGSDVALQAADGHRLNAYRTGPDRADSALVVAQEIFGVNAHIRRVCDGFAVEGYAVIAPALFDRVQPGITLAYTPEDVAIGRELRPKVAPLDTLADIEAAASALSEAGCGRIGIVGYCWGGTVAWWGGTRSSMFKAAVGWYGGGIAAAREETPLCPVQLHFGALDKGIPLSDVEAIRAAQPEVDIYVYDAAGHGFGCDERDSFNEKARDLAESRTLSFLRQHLRPG